MKYELKKLFSSVFMWACLSIVIIFMAFFVYKSYESRGESAENYQKLLSEYAAKGLSGEQIYSELRSRSDDLQVTVSNAGEAALSMSGEYESTLMGDFLLYNKAANYADYLYNKLPLHRRQIIKDSMYEIFEENSNQNPNQTLISQHEKSIETYNRVINVSFEDGGDLDNTTFFFDFTIWDYAMTAFVIMLCVRMFTLDKSCGAYKVVYTSKRGRANLFFKQLFSCFLVVTVIIILQAVCQLVCGALFFGVRNLSLPIQSVETYEFCPYIISIGRFMLIKTLGKVLYAVMVAAIAAMFAVLMRKALPAIICSVVLCVAPMIFNSYFYYQSTGEGAIAESFQLYQKLRIFLPQCLLNPNEYFIRFDLFNLFGLNINRLAAVLILTAVLTVAASAVAFMSFVRARRK